jgi:hypothetical protein
LRVLVRGRVGAPGVPVGVERVPDVGVGDPERRFGVRAEALLQVRGELGEPVCVVLLGGELRDAVDSPARCDALGTGLVLFGQLGEEVRVVHGVDEPLLLREDERGLVPPDLVERPGLEPLECGLVAGLRVPVGLAPEVVLVAQLVLHGRREPPHMEKQFVAGHRVSVEGSDLVGLAGAVAEHGHCGDRQRGEGDAHTGEQGDGPA